MILINLLTWKNWTHWCRCRLLPQKLSISLRLLHFLYTPGLLSQQKNCNLQKVTNRILSNLGLRFHISLWIQRVDRHNIQTHLCNSNLIYPLFHYFHHMLHSIHSLSIACAFHESVYLAKNHLEQIMEDLVFRVVRSYWLVKAEEQATAEYVEIAKTLWPMCYKEWCKDSQVWPLAWLTNKNVRYKMLKKCRLTCSKYTTSQWIWMKWSVAAYAQSKILNCAND